MTATLGGFANGLLVGALASAAGFPWWGSTMFAALSCLIMALAVGH